MDTSRSHGPVARLIALVGAAIGLGNLFLYLLITPMIGGSATNGGIRKGHYYLGEYGRYTEVSAMTYRINLLHGRSLLFTVPAGLMCLIWFRFIKEDDDQYSPIGRKTI
jgi:hypothetical protein